jgi:hypothetical protein
MRTYKKTIESPLLEIRNDVFYPNPRKFQDNLGYFITKERNNISPDKNETLEETIESSYNISDNVESHIKNIKKFFNENNFEKIIKIYPVIKHEHGSTVYFIGEKKGFDYGICGFYIITDKTSEILGTPKKFFKKVISQELYEYTQWANGEVYEYILKNESGETIENVTGFYSIDDIKTELGKEWQNENLEEYFLMNQ